MIIPVFIYRDHPTSEEVERKLKWKEIFRKDEERERERKRIAEYEKRQAILDAHTAKMKQFEKEYSEGLKNNWWDYQFLPEGWSIFGQTDVCVIKEI